MKILLLVEDCAPHSVTDVLAHPVDHHWSEQTLRDEFHAASGFVPPCYQIAENPTPQQLADGLRTQRALHQQAIRKKWGSSEAYQVAFRQWLTTERGFQPIAWEEI